MTSIELSESKRRLLEKMLHGDGTALADRPDTVVPRPPGKRVSISPEQRHIWLHAGMAEHLPLYNESMTIHRRGPFDLAAFKASLDEFLCRHEIWRTSFEPADGDIVQVVHPELRVQLPFHDLSHLPEAERERAALRIATQRARQPLNLADVPLFRADVVRLAADYHRVYLTLHHIIFDGVSIYQVLMPELAALYDALAGGKKPALSRPALQYCDYTLWRERQIAGDEIARQMKHWRRELAGELPVLALPTDRPRPSEPTYSGSMTTFGLSGGLTESLKALSRRKGVTLYATLVAAFKALLHRYSGQEDIVLGGVTDLRRRPELEGLMGYLLNAFALRTRPTAEQRFDQYLAQVHNTLFGALAASDVPFDRVVRELQPRRSTSAHPLFQVLFWIEPLLAPLADGWNLTQMDVTNGTAKFDLYIEVDERPGGLIGRWIYSTDLFDAATIQRMIRHWTRVLETIVAEPDIPLGDLPLLSDDESRQLAQWNATTADAPRLSLHAWFEAQAQQTPDAVAVVAEGGQIWTYRELNQRAGQVATRLRSIGIGPETLVAICVERSLDMLAGLLGILKAGGAYLPLDPDFPPARLALIVDEARPVALLTQRSLQSRFPRTGAQLVLLEACGNDGDGRSAEVGPDDLAYVIYTSGSTGRPKGVEIPHRAIVNLLASMQRKPGFTSVDVLLALTTISFDIATLELFLPLVTGGQVVIAGRGTVRDPQRVGALIERSGCTVAQATPTTWRALVETGWSGRDGLKILCGGEPLPRDLADCLLRRCTSLWNMYGPTETTVWSTIDEVRPGYGPVAIGRPIANTTTYILDSRGNPLPVGVPGELFVGGAGVARGYRHQEELTRQRFLTRTVAPTERLYRTGDLARYRADGTIECLGRTDDQVKIRGARIELGEIEALVARHPGVAAAAVKAWPQRRSGEWTLTAYYVPCAGAAPEAPELRRFLRRLAPDYMVPSHYVALPALPTTPNGKSDRNALPEPCRDAPRASRVGLGSERESQLAAIWSDALGVSPLGPHDDFFDLGGHSLLVVRVLRRIEAAFGVRLPPAAFFHAPTIARMAALLGDLGTATAPLPRIVELQPRGSRPPLFWLGAEPAFRELAEAVGPNQPFLAVDLRLDELGTQVSCGLEEIAHGLVQAIRAAQPAGPYFLGGRCARGILAFEVASQLMRSGHEVGLLVLLHAANPAAFRRIDELAFQAGKLKFHVAESIHLRGRQRWTYAAERVRRGLDRVLRLSGSERGLREVEGSDVLDRAARPYQPKPYAGKVVLLQPTKRPAVLDYRSGWRPIVKGEFAAYDLPGTHWTMLQRPHVQCLGAVLGARLAWAQEAATTQPMSTV